MRIYNGKESLIDMPLTNRVRLTIPSRSVSGEFMPSSDFLKLIATVFTDADIALIVSGPYELNLCAKHPVITPMIAYSLDEAVIRFNKPDKEEVKKEEEPVAEAVVTEPVTTPVIEEEAVEEPMPVEEEESVEEGIPATDEEVVTPKKKSKKRK